jgi:hypothetical protein
MFSDWIDNFSMHKGDFNILKMSLFYDVCVFIPVAYFIYVQVF